MPKFIKFLKNVNSVVTKHFAYWTVRLHLGHFAYWTLSLLVISPTRHFDYYLDSLPID